MPGTSQPVASMTGFSRAQAQHPGGLIVWELRSVNGKGLDLRLRLPPRFEGLEIELRRRAALHLTRGNIQASLAVQRDPGEGRRVIDTPLLMQYAAEAQRLVTAGLATPPTADGLLALRGVLDQPEDPSQGDEAESFEPILTAFDEALAALVTARRQEGVAIAAMLARRLDELEMLAAAAEADPARNPDAIKARLRAQVEALLDTGAALDAGRLLQEAALLATRADIREELDRLHTHLAAGRALLAEGGPIGRRLDFLSQEFNRESNTLCAKSNAASLTAIGLNMKTVIDQFREQVQNIE